MSDDAGLSAAKIVVLDDDPTGTQTVHGVTVLTEWSVGSLAAELVAPGRCFFVLTNSRAYPVERACAINREIGANLIAARNATGHSFRVISRGDSTLRGHFPAETDALAGALGRGPSATLIVPAFFEGGRITIGDVHYVVGPDGPVPVGETEFARDASFGYRSSNLREWVEEKTGGRVRANEVTSISLDDLREGPVALAAKLESLSNNAVAVVNARERSDLEAFAEGVREAESRGKRFLFRTAASFVATYTGIGPRPLRLAEEIAGVRQAGGLVVVGSHVGRTTGQLNSLLERGGLVAVEIPVEALLTQPQRANVVHDAARRVSEGLNGSAGVVLYTSRELIRGRNAGENLAIGELVSSGLVEIVSRLDARPRWLISKGGITSSDIATRALGVKRAMVPGQALPGVPVWRLGGESRWPGLAYVVFPGNVGDVDALRDLVDSLRS